MVESVDKKGRVEAPTRQLAERPEGTRRRGTARERIVQAGRRLFFAEGFKGVATDALAKEAAVSKATLYKYFPNMVAVLRAVVEAETAKLGVGVPPDVTSLGEFEGALVRYGENLLRFLNGREMVQFATLMFEEARFHPDIADTFYRAAYGRAVGDLGRTLGLGLERGFVVSALSAEELAEQLLGMWEGFRFVRAQLGLTERPFEDPRAWSEKCVETFLGRRLGAF